MSLGRFVFLDEGGPRRGGGWVLVPAAVVVAGLVWWFVVPPRVDRPAGPVWCPSGTQRFDAREILGMEFGEGYDHARERGCTVRDHTGGGDDSELTSRISVFVSRGVITKIDGIY
jgi:hypothetical protein